MPTANPRAITMAKLVREMAKLGRLYVDSRIPRTFLGIYMGARRECEHCDGESSRLVRKDDLRGRVCPCCDSALDEMFEEGAYAHLATAEEMP